MEQLQIFDKDGKALHIADVMAMLPIPKNEELAVLKNLCKDYTHKIKGDNVEINTLAIYRMFELYWKMLSEGN